jgi:hypothetical protein
MAFRLLCYATLFLLSHAAVIEYSDPDIITSSEIKHHLLLFYDVDKSAHERTLKEGENLSTIDRRRFSVRVVQPFSSQLSWSHGLACISSLAVEPEFKGKALHVMIHKSHPDIGDWFEITDYPSVVFADTSQGELKVTRFKGNLSSAESLIEWERKYHGSPGELTGEFKSQPVQYDEGAPIKEVVASDYHQRVIEKSAAGFTVVVQLYMAAKDLTTNPDKTLETGRMGFELFSPAWVQLGDLIRANDFRALGMEKVVVVQLDIKNNAIPDKQIKISGLSPFLFLYPAGKSKAPIEFMKETKASGEAVVPTVDRVLAWIREGLPDDPDGALGGKTEL